MVQGKRWVIGKPFEGSLTDANFHLEEFSLPNLNDGEILVEAVYLTVDPYMRMAMISRPAGDTIAGEQVAKVVESKNAEYPVGTHIVTSPGWVTHSISNGEGISKIDPNYPKDLPLSLALGTLGMTGRSAYIGMTEIGQIKAGETVFVSGAAGAVGSVAGQMAKIMGCRVLGSAGSDEKVAYVKELGFDEVFNYNKVKDIDATIKGLAPNGIDVYFDNVGGDFSMMMIKHMRIYGRVVVCGAISEYNLTDPQKYPSIFCHLLFNSIKVHGFTNFHYTQLYPKAIAQLSEWIQKGQLKYREDVTEGFQNMPKAFMALFLGANKGKAIIKM
ncbi:prostaglandin reductase 1-like [Amphiura filiformis]|uniref:prostaglandin reductase 1-like n=1 Tax=Amphiura filiformis TaxID=82378 RepID=UPI003B225964